MENLNSVESVSVPCEEEYSVENGRTSDSVLTVSCDRYPISKIRTTVMAINRERSRTGANLLGSEFKQQCDEIEGCLLEEVCAGRRRVHGGWVRLGRTL